jgi:hypothetical protein
MQGQGQLKIANSRPLGSSGWPVVNHVDAVTVSRQAVSGGSGGSRLPTRGHQIAQGALEGGIASADFELLRDEAGY